MKKSLIDAKGDLIAGSADNTVVRVPVGANGFVLKADSAQASVSLGLLRSILTHLFPVTCCWVLTITAATHGLGSGLKTVQVFESGTIVGVETSVNSGTGDVTITVPVGFEFNGAALIS